MTQSNTVQNGLHLMWCSRESAFPSHLKIQGSLLHLLCLHLLIVTAKAAAAAAATAAAAAGISQDFRVSSMCVCMFIYLHIYM